MHPRQKNKTSKQRTGGSSRPGLVLVLIMSGALSVASCGNDDAPDPESALNTYADGINAHSVDDAMAAFAEESRLIDHPLHPGILNGKAQVRRGVGDTVSNSRRDPDAYSISDVVVDGDTVSWSYVWNNGGRDFCAVGNEIDVDDRGLIVEMRWGDDPGECNNDE